MGGLGEDDVRWYLGGALENKVVDPWELSRDSPREVMDPGASHSDDGLMELSDEYWFDRSSRNQRFG